MTITSTSTRPWREPGECTPPVARRAADVERAADLRRRHARREIERVVENAAALPDPDRILIETVYRDGRSVADVARLSGDDPGALRRRVRALVRRVMSPEFAYVIARRHLFAPQRRVVADSVILRGRTMRETARAMGVSLHVVRRHREAITDLADAFTRQRRQPPAAQPEHRPAHPSGHERRTA